MSPLILAVALLPLQTKVRIEGDGYLRFSYDSRAVYAREATLTVADGHLCQEHGLQTLPTINVSDQAETITVDRDGSVFIVISGQKVKAGTLVLAKFSSGEEPIPSKLLMIATGKPQLGYAGKNGFGTITSGSARISEPKPTEQPITKPEPPTTKPETTSAEIHGAEPDKTRLPEKKQDVLPGKVTPPHDAQVSKPKVMIHTESEVDTDQIRLGDVADLEGPADWVQRVSGVSLGETPALGVDRIIDQVRVEARLQAAGFKRGEIDVIVPGGSRVTRKGQKIEHQQFVDEAMRFATKQMAGDGTLSSERPGVVMIAPSGDLKLVAETIARSGRNVSVMVAAYVDGKRFNSRTVTLALDDDPTGGIRIGSKVKVHVRSNGVSLQTDGLVKRVDARHKTVEIQTPDGVTLIGKVGANGVIEVQI